MSLEALVRALLLVVGLIGLAGVIVVAWWICRDVWEHPLRGWDG